MRPMFNINETGLYCFIGQQYFITSICLNILNRKVDFEIIKILKQRYHRCSFYERAANEWIDYDKICLKEKDDLFKAEMNLFIKCMCLIIQLLKSNSHSNSQHLPRWWTRSLYDRCACFHEAKASFDFWTKTKGKCLQAFHGRINKNLSPSYCL